MKPADGNKRWCGDLILLDAVITAKLRSARIAAAQKNVTIFIMDSATTQHTQPL